MPSTKIAIMLTLIVILIDQKVNTNEVGSQAIHRQSRFLILPGSVYVNSTNWSPLDGIMKTWGNLINWKVSTFGAIKNWVRNLISKTPIDVNCLKEGKPVNNQSMLHDLKSKLFKDWKKQSTTTANQGNSDDPMPQTLQQTSTSPTTSPKSTTSSPTKSTNLLTPASTPTSTPASTQASTTPPTPSTSTPVTTPAATTPTPSTPLTPSTSTTPATTQASTTPPTPSTSTPASTPTPSTTPVTTPAATTPSTPQPTTVNPGNTNETLNEI